MLQTTSGKQLSFYSTLYDRIPEDHLLKKIEDAVDFHFINSLLEDSYCKTFGRPAKEPEMMMKLCFLEFIYNLSDKRMIEEANCNLAYLWFLGLNPEDELPHPSLIAKFRTQRLTDITLDEVLSEIVRQCIETGIIKSDSVSIDATHMEANCTKKVPERIMKHLAKRIFKGLENDNGEVPETVNTEIPDYQQIEDHQEAKNVMKNYLETTMEAAAEYAGENTKLAIEEARDVLSDEKFLIQKGLRSLYDKDARVGNKSKTSQFFGYKIEFMMTTKEKIITAIDAHSGEYVDGKEFGILYDKTNSSGLHINEMYGDKGYFRKDILDQLNKDNVQGYIPVSASVYKINEELFDYNKDSDQWFCFMGNSTEKCTKIHKTRNKKKTDYLKYTFAKEQCATCPHRNDCMGKGKTKARSLTVSLNTAAYHELNQMQKTPEFQEKYKKRAAHESKNAEMKRFHRMARAKNCGLRSAQLQAKFTALAVNFIRIAALA